ncbi:MAG: response regulator [Candidatus Eremiobacteraeota bacterium]|nr:response regulator [Candidatus Eremiobacteraeota bacterium]
MRTTVESDPEMMTGRVLVVDDEENIVTLLLGWLETTGCEVDSACDGREALDKARANPPDVILMDCMMPEMSGYDVCQEMKQDERLRHVPILFLTARNEVQDVVKGLDLGAHGYLTKPFKPQELLARLRSVLRIKKLQDRLLSRTDELRTEWDWVRAVMHHLPVGVVVVDEFGKAVYFNRQTAERFALNEAQGQPVEELFSLEGAEATVWRNHSFDGMVGLRVGATRLDCRMMTAGLDGGRGTVVTLVF